MPMTNEQLAAILEMGDISGAEQNLARQQALTGALRQKTLQGGGTGTMGGITNAIAGLGAGLGYRQGMKMQDALGGQRADALGRVKTALGLGVPAGPQQLAGPGMDGNY